MDQEKPGPFGRAWTEGQGGRPAAAAWGPRLAITIAAGTGFVALLVASRYLPGFASELRLGAVAWLAGLGALKLAIVLRAWRRRAGSGAGPNAA